MEGELDYAAYLRCLSKLDDNICLMLEHMTDPNDYTEATRHLSSLAASLGLHFHKPAGRR